MHETAKLACTIVMTGNTVIGLACLSADASRRLPWTAQGVACSVLPQQARFPERLQRQG